MRLSNIITGSVFGLIFIPVLVLSTMNLYWWDVSQGLNSVAMACLESVFTHAFAMLVCFWIAKKVATEVLLMLGVDGEYMVYSSDPLILVRYTVNGLCVMYGFVLMILVSGFTDDHYFDYRDFKDVKISYAKEYSNHSNLKTKDLNIADTFVDSQLAKFTDVDREFILKNSKFDLRVDDVLTVANFRNVNKYDIFGRAFEASMKNFIGHSSSLDDSKKRHQLLHANYMSPYSDTEFNSLHFIELKSILLY